MAIRWQVEVMTPKQIGLLHINRCFRSQLVLLAAEEPGFHPSEAGRIGSAGPGLALHPRTLTPCASSPRGPGCSTVSVVRCE